MGQWTLVEGTLADGLPMRLYVAVHNGNLWSASLQDDAHPRTEDEFAWRLGKGDKWVRCESGAGPELLASAAKQIVEYFSGRLLSFDLPLGFRGTPFQVRVWQELMRIP